MINGHPRTRQPSPGNYVAVDVAVASDDSKAKKRDSAVRFDVRPEARADGPLERGKHQKMPQGLEQKAAATAE